MLLFFLFEFENRKHHIGFVERGHCKHCPEEGSYSEMVHRTFEDEMYTTLSVIVITTVMLLIFLSTAGNSFFYQYFMMKSKENKQN